MWLGVCRNRKRIGVAFSIKNLASQGKSIFLCKTRSIIWSILDFLAPNDIDNGSDERLQQKKSLNWLYYE